MANRSTASKTKSNLKLVASEMGSHSSGSGSAPETMVPGGLEPTAEMLPGRYVASAKARDTIRNSAKTLISCSGKSMTIARTRAQG